MLGINRGFMNLDELFPRPKKEKALEGTCEESIADLVAGIRAGFGQEAAETALREVSESAESAMRSPATDYLRTSLEQLETQYGKDEVLASLQKVTENQPKPPQS